MSWNCPYLKNDGVCELRNKECDPLEAGCILLANAKYKRLFKKGGEIKPSYAPSQDITQFNKTKGETQ